MKARKTLTLLLLAALTLAACKYDDSELWEQVNQNTEELAAQAARIAALEAWQAETNTNIEALQTLLSTTDYITAVTPVVKDGVEVGFTISFLNTPAITIYHGTKGDKGDKGDTPQIGATQADDGNSNPAPTATTLRCPSWPRARSSPTKASPPTRRTTPSQPTPST